MFLSSGAWARLHLKTLEGGLRGPAGHGSEGLESGFIPLAGKKGGPQSHQDACAALLRQAEERAAHIEREAYDKGFAQGEKDGLELGQKKAEKVMVHLERVLEEVSGLKQHLAKVYEKELLHLVLCMAKRIVRRETLGDETLIERTVLSALELAADRSQISLRLHPDDLRTIEKLKPGLFGRFQDLKGLVVTPDSSVGRGGCMLESPCGDVDARIETQMEELNRVMDEAFRNQDS